MHAIEAGAPRRMPAGAAGEPQAALIRGHASLVHKVARQVHGQVASALAIEDLVQIGQVALIEAAASFVDRGVASFGTYATVRLRGAMIDELRRSSTLSRDALRRRRQFEATRRRIENRLGRTASEAEMAAGLDLSPAEYRRAADGLLGLRYASLDDMISDHSPWFADDRDDPFEALADTHQRRDIAAAIAELPTREQQVLQLYFVEELGLDQIGSVLGVSAARVCQLKRRALERVRARLVGWQH